MATKKTQKTLSKTESVSDRARQLTLEGHTDEQVFTVLSVEETQQHYQATRLEMMMAVEAELDDSSLLELRRRVETVVVHRPCRGCTTNDDQDVVIEQ